ncbi:MAG TPA: chemotaxis protein CheX [Terracidiphilus sp.]
MIKASQQFWEQMLSMTLEPIFFPERFCLPAGHVHANVDLFGTWSGRIEVRLAERLAYEATAAMMMQAIDTINEADALDAAREIANMIAGVIKPSLPRPCNMTIPRSRVAGDAFCSAARTEDSVVVAFRHQAGDLMVRVWELTPGSYAETAHQNKEH